MTTTAGIVGSSNTELQFGLDGNLYGLGTNSWIYRYDFTSGTKSVFAQPAGDLGATGLAQMVPELGSGLLLLVSALGLVLGRNGLRSCRERRDRRCSALKFRAG